MLNLILYPALIVSPYVAFTFDAERGAADTQYIATVIKAKSDQLTLHILNGAYNVTIDADGQVADSDSGAIHRGSNAYIQWQGHATSYMTQEDLYVDQMDYARTEILAGRTGPLHVAQFASSEQISKIGVANAARRLAILGDRRLMRFLAAEFPQINAS